MKRILYVVNPRAPISQWDRLGDLALAQSLAREYKNRNPVDEVTIISGRPSINPEEHTKGVSTKMKDLKCHIDTEYVYEESKVFSQKKYYQYIRDWVTSFKPDVIHVHQAQVSVAPHIYKLSKETGVPVIWTLHNPPEGRSAYQYKSSFSDILSLPNCRIVCVSRSARDRFLSAFKYEDTGDVAKRLRYIYNGVQPTFASSFSPTSSRTPYEYEYIGIGRIDPPKSTEELLKFMASDPSKKCAYIGDTFATYPTDPDYVKRCYEILQRSPNITWFRSVPHEMINSYLYKSKYYVTFSRVETFSLTSCEAMMVGTPVICFDVAGTGDIVPEFAGIKIPVIPRARMSRYHQYINDHLEEEYNHLDIRRYAEENFSVRSMAQEYSDLYKEVLE